MKERSRWIERLGAWSQNKGSKKPANESQKKLSKIRRFSEELTKRPHDWIQMDMGKLREAVEAALNPYNPCRYDLYLLYNQAITDSEVKSQARTAINKMIAEPFLVSVNGVENQALAEYFQRPWFEKLLKYVFWSELYGYTLIEFDRMGPSGEFNDCIEFPRAYVRPDTVEILTDPIILKGAPVGDIMKPLGLIPVGDAKDLGTLETLTREVIWKNFSRSDWATYSEKFGNPMIYMLTDSDGEDWTKRVNMLRNFASSGWAMGDKEGDEIQIVEPASRNGAQDLFLLNIKLSEENIAKMINGQTGTANNEAWAGTANVHERVMGDYHDARLRTATNIINYELIPFLIYWGYPLQGAKFRFPALDPKSTIDLSSPMQGPVNSLRAVGRRMPVATDKVDRMLEEYLKRVYEGQAELDPSVWKYNYQALVNAIMESGLTFNIKHKLFDLASELRTNAAVFAAFKNHREMEDLTSLLTSQEGTLRSFSEFKKLAKPLTIDYNINWLQTEYTNAVTSAQMAKKWAGFEENKARFPNLEYRAVVDSQTRPEHARLDGLVLPMNDPRWNRIYPPNGHNCRCSVTQTSRPVREIEESKNFNPEPGFDHNPGKDKKLFSDTNAYQSIYKSDEQVSIQKEAQELMKNA